MKASPETDDRTKPKSVISRREILDAAAALFRAKGYYATTLRDIASAVGMKAGSVYYHFDSKEQILEEVLDIGIQAVFDAVRDGVEKLPAGTPWRERFCVALEAHLTALLKLGDYTSANIRVFGQAPKSIQERHLRVRRSYEAYWKDFYQRAWTAGEIRENLNLTALRLLAFGGMNWAIEWYKPSKGAIEKLAKAYADILFDGAHPVKSASQPTPSYRTD